MFSNSVNTEFQTCRIHITILFIYFSLWISEDIRKYTSNRFLSSSWLYSKFYLLSVVSRQFTCSVLSQYTRILVHTPHVEPVGSDIGPDSCSGSQIRSRSCEEKNFLRPAGNWAPVPSLSSPSLYRLSHGGHCSAFSPKSLDTFRRNLLQSDRTEKISDFNRCPTGSIS
jgi:hypothetical protein